jgi:DNA-binding NtrC family response regulator
MSKAVLVVSGDSSHRETLAAAIEGCGLEARLCATTDEAWGPLVRDEFRAVLSEDTLPDGDFTSVICAVKLLRLNTPVIVVSRRDDWKSCMAALARGATDYLAYPPNAGEVEQSLRTGRKLALAAAA